MENLYKCAGPTMGLLQHFFWKKKKDKCPRNARGGGEGGDASDWN